MIQGLFTGASGVTSSQFRVDNIAYNIANVNTIGFKNVRTDFKDALYSTLQRPVQPQDQLNLQQGHGLQASATNRQLTQGAVNQTGNMLDMALEGKGYYAVTSGGGEVLYTREGTFHVSQEGETNYLVMPNGYYVLDANGGRIELPKGSEGLEVAENGAIYYEDGEQIGTLAIYTFPNRAGLEAAGENAFRETEASGAALVDTETRVKQGYAEQSNVQLAQEMTRLIRTQRALQFSSRVIRMADDMEGVANSIRS